MSLTRVGAPTERMEEAQNIPGPGSPVRHRWMIEYDITGDLKFISHHDTIRLFERLLARAAVPVRFTEGFNPHPRMTIPLPRPLGVASEAEAVIFETTTDLDAGALYRRLADQTPVGLDLRAAHKLSPGEKLQPAHVAYRLEPEEPLGPDVAGRVARVLASEHIEVERHKPGESKTKTVDVRPWILDMSIDGDAVTFTLTVSERGTAKPAEIAGLLGYEPGAINHRIRRTAVTWR